MFRLWAISACAPIFAAQMLTGAALAGGLAATTLFYGAFLPGQWRR